MTSYMAVWPVILYAILGLLHNNLCKTGKNVFMYDTTATLLRTFIICVA